MAEKSVTDRIFEKFAESVANDTLFHGISDELVAMMRRKTGKNELKELLRKNKDENPKS
jgi:hypothetical protein